MSREGLLDLYAVILATNSSMKSRVSTRVLLALGATLLLWSSAYAGILAGLKGYSPTHLALLRFLVASSVLAIYAGLAHFRRPELRDISGIALFRRDWHYLLQSGA